MGFDIGNLAGIKIPQATIPVTDMSPEMNGTERTAAPVRTSTADENFTLYGGVAVVVVALVSLWLLGAVAFRGLPSV